MKKLLHLALRFFVVACIILSQQSCLKDSCRQTYKLYRPIYQSLSAVRANMRSTAPQALQSTGKLTVYGNYIFLNEKNKGIHVIDNTIPASPKNIGFIAIPNNVDIAIKGSYLYADSYSDIIVFDISNPVATKPVKFMNNVMKEKNVYWWQGITNADSIQIVTGYTEKDTTVDCASYSRWNSCANCSYATTQSTGFYSASPQTGTGGSLASFTIIDNYLYTVSSTSLYCLNIADASNPQQTAVKNLGWGIETIYPFQNKLFIGSNTGMSIFDVSNAGNPSLQSTFTHATRCDPVIADARYAYVTLRTGTTCNGNTNELNIVDVSNLSSPVLKRTYSLVNPYGLSKDGSTLFVCDGRDGIKIYNASAPENLQLLKQFTGVEAYDVIAMNHTAIVVAKDGLYQYDYTDATNIRQVSKMAISK